MADFREGTAEESAFLGELIDAGVLIESGVPGVYGFDGTFVEIRDRVAELVTRQAAEDRPIVMRFPPVLPKRMLEDTGYMSSFPHLGTSVFGFKGSEKDAAELGCCAAEHRLWPHLAQTDLVLTPAACYPVYPAVAKRGPLAAGGICVDAGAGLVFRNEPSGDPARMQMFHQRELVRIGEPENVAAWREKWRDRALQIFAWLGLDAQCDVASDPFFGRGGRMMGMSQREQALKFEVRVPIASPEPTAVASFNYHREHFTHLHAIAMDGGGEAHTACLGFGLERCTLALIRKHGLELASWPASVREVLWR